MEQWSHFCTHKGLIIITIITHRNGVKVTTLNRSINRYFMEEANVMQIYKITFSVHVMFLGNFKWQNTHRREFLDKVMGNMDKILVLMETLLKFFTLLIF